MALKRSILPVALVVALLSGSVPLEAKEPSARSLAKDARKFEKKGDFARAYLLYSQAAAADPSSSEYWLRAQALRRKAVNAANVMPTGAAPLAPEPEPEIVPLSEDERVEVRQPQPPVELAPSPDAKDFDLRADAKSLWEQVSKGYGLDVVFDGDFQPGPVIPFRMAAAGYREAIHALMSATGTFFVPISTRLMLIVKDTEQKRREVENSVAVSIPIPDPVTIQEAQELGRTVQQVMEIQRFAIDSSQRMVVFRDRVSKVRPAQLLFEQLMAKRTQIGIEIELLAASKSTTTDFGLGLPTSFPITAIQNSITLAGGPLNFAIGISSLANLVAKRTQSNSRTLYQAYIRSSDLQPSSLHIGEKYPIMTLNYIGSPAAEGEQVFTPPPSFNFEDLGLVLKITPKIHDSAEVTLEIEAEFKLLGGASLNGIPVISSRKFQTRARLSFDEAAIVSGLVSQNDFRILTGPAGLINIPVIGPALGQVSRTMDDVQVLLVMKPRLLSPPPTEFITRDIWVGSESRPRIPL